MRRKTFLHSVISVILSLSVAGCGTSSDKKTETPQITAAGEAGAVTAEPVQQKEGMKEVEICGTVYTIPEDWYTEVIDENNTAIYFSTEKLKEQTIKSSLPGFRMYGTAGLPMPIPKNVSGRQPMRITCNCLIKAKDGRNGIKRKLQADMPEEDFDMLMQLLKIDSKSELVSILKGICPACGKKIADPDSLIISQSSECIMPSAKENKSRSL